MASTMSRGRIVGAHFAQRRRGLIAFVGKPLGMSPQAGRAALLTMTDQGFASMSNFAVGVVVARIAGVAGLGAFSLAYACWVLLINIHRAVITDPMAILGDARADEVAERIRRGVAAELVLGLAATCVIVTVGVVLLLAGWHTFAEGMLAFAPWVVFLNLQDYWRMVGFMKRLPGKSLMNDTVFNVFQAVAFVLVFVLKAHSVFAVVSAWGFAAAAGALYGFLQFSTRPSLKGGFGLLRERWQMSKWLVSSSLTSWGSTSLYLVVVGAVLGPVGLGGLRAAQNLAWGPLAVVMQAGTSLGLPEASRALDARGRAGLRKVSRLVSGATLFISTASAVVVFVAGGPLLRLLYGASFARHHTTASVAALGMMLGAIALGPQISLKVLKQVHWLFVVQVVGLATSTVSAGILAYEYGVTGAAAGIAGTGIVFLFVVLFFLRLADRSVGPVEVSANVGSQAAAPWAGELSHSRKGQ
jgi:O-antigen/teichoic acid export membrane protein